MNSDELFFAVVWYLVGAAVVLFTLYWIIRAAVARGITDALGRVNLAVLGNGLRGGSDAPTRPASDAD